MTSSIIVILLIVIAILLLCVVMGKTRQNRTDIQSEDKDMKVIVYIFFVTCCTSKLI